MSRARILALACALPLAGAVRSHADPPCPGHWHDTGFEPGLTNTIGSLVLSGNVYALAVDPLSPTPALLAAGSFNTAFGQPLPRVGRWSEGGWSAFGAGLSSTVNAIASIDLPGDRGGPQLVVGGSFTKSGEAPILRVARWTGEQWLPLGGGVDGTVLALCSFDDGSGPALYAAGEFTHADGLAANHVARWDGRSWSPVGVRGGGVAGGGVDGTVRALAVFDDGSGPRLFAAGDFVHADGIGAKHIAAFNDKEWSSVGAGLDSNVQALEVFDLGAGPALYAGGISTAACCAGDGTLAVWNGATWSSPPGTFNGAIYALHSTIVGGTPTLLIGGNFTQIDQGAIGYVRQRITGYDGASWKLMGSVGNAVRAIASVPSASSDVGDPTLYIGGTFVSTNGGLAEGIARWNGSKWRRVSTPMPGFWTDNTVYDAIEATIDGEPALVVAGTFQIAGDKEIGAVATWRDGAFEPLGSGLAGSAYGLLASTREPGVIYAAGTFEDGDGVASTNYGLMRLDTSAGADARWTPMATVTNSSWYAYGYTVAEFDDGDGPALYLGGTFEKVNGVPSWGIARFDGTTWSQVGVPFYHDSQVWALKVYDSGSGPRLYCAGNAGPAGSPYGSVFAWDGRAWSGIGYFSAIDPPWALAVHDDGSGAKLYIAGDFEKLYRWNGQAVEMLGDVGYGRRRMLSHDFGSGPKLLIAGSQGSITPMISAWTGSTIMPIPGVFAFSSSLGTDGQAWALAPLADGRFMVGGAFRWINEVPGVRPMAYVAAYDPSAAPWIVDHPDDALAAAGEGVQFGVALFEDLPTEPVAYAWRHDGVALVDGASIAGAKTATLLVTVTSAADAGLYDVVVSNECGESVSRAAILVVTCAGDIDGDGSVGGGDLGALLGAWGTSSAAFDLNGDGVVDAADLAALVAAWGPC